MIMLKGDMLPSAAKYAAQRRQARFQGSARMQTNDATNTHTNTYIS